jgi:rare lipoprotein A
MLLVVLLLCPGCVRRVWGGYAERGIASWYGNEHHGRRTASGEVFDQWAMTAAHKTLPFDTIVLVKNRADGRTVRVRITDRGPFVRGRIIDLSKGAAVELGMLEEGIAPVRIEVVKWGQGRHTHKGFWRRIF